MLLFYYLLPLFCLLCCNWSVLAALPVKWKCPRLRLETLVQKVAQGSLFPWAWLYPGQAVGKGPKQSLEGW
jgi:hypothetical protein